MELPATDEIRAAIESVLSRPEFLPPSKSFLERIRDAVREAIGGVIDRVLSLLGAGLSERWVSRVALAVILVALALLVLHLVRTILRAYRRAGAAAGAAAGARGGAPATQAALSPGASLAAAAEHAASGRFLEAARALYLGVLLWLDEAGHARFDESKTGAEYAREIGASRVRSAFAAVLRAFYPIAFGGRPDAREAYERMVGAARDMGVPA